MLICIIYLYSFYKHLLFLQFSVAYTFTISSSATNLALFWPDIVLSDIRKNRRYPEMEERKKYLSEHLVKALTGNTHKHRLSTRALLR